MSELFRMQIDYLIFLEGLSYLILGSICYFSLAEEKKRGAPWLWLGWFGFLRGAKEWLGLISLAVGGNNLFSSFQLALSAASFFCLIEFARAGSADLHGRATSRWLHLPLIILAVSGMGYGSAGLDLTVNTVPALAGGLWAALVLVRTYRSEEDESRSLLVLGVSLGLYSIGYTFGSLAWWNGQHGGFSGILWQAHLVKTLFALSALTAIWAYAGSPARAGNIAGQGYGNRKSIYLINIAASFAILLLGWALTDALGKLAERELRENMITRAVTAATAINPELVSRLSASGSDNDAPDFEYLRRQLITIHDTNPQCRFVYLFGMKDGRVVFLVDAEPEDSEDYSPPGQVYEEASVMLLDSFSSGYPFIEGPVTDRWGEWYSALAPIKDKNGRVVAVFGMDVSAADWPVKIAAYRLAAIAITMILLLTALFFAAMRANKDEARKRAASEKRFRAIFENATEGIFVFDTHTRRLLDVNPYVIKWLGYEYAELLEKTIDDLFVTGLRDIQKDLFAERGQELGQVKEGKCLKKDGTLVDAAMTGTTLKFRDRDCVLVIARDESRRKRAEEKMRSAHQQLLDIIEFLPDATLVVGQDRKVIAWNRAMEEMTGVSKGEMIGRDSQACAVPSCGWTRPVLIDLIFSGDRDCERQYSYVERKGNKLYAETYAPNVRGKGAYLWITASPLFDNNGQLVGAIESIRDTTERRKTEEQLKYLATHDSLTNILNRYSLEEALQGSVDKAKRGESSALLFIDLDNFKLVNDTYGHAAGDELLINLVKILKNSLRKSDLLARLGGDEFAVLLEGTSAREAGLVAEKLRRLVDESELYLRANSARVNLSVSIGIVMVDGTLDSQKLLSHADTALYAAKEEGRNRVAFVQPGEDKVAKNSETNRMIGLLKNALKENKFSLFYQPVFEVHNRSIIHHEALIRLRGEGEELITPGRFIPIAERFGLMPKIDRWVVQASLEALQKYPDLNLFVNLSGISLGDETILEFIEESISCSKIDPARLGFEITETVAVKDLIRAERWIRRLKSLGCSFALDDFGIGFSSFSYLRILPVDYLKIDGSFVCNLHTEATHCALVQAMNAVAQNLGKKTIAEFVENEDIMNILKSLGVDCAQGYYLGKPSPVPVRS